jgi:hypothetical protein
MRQKLNENPLAQVAIVGVLLVAAAFMILSSKGGGEEAEEGATTTSSATVTSPEGSATVTATVTTSGQAAVPSSVAGAPEVPAPPLPRPVTAAFDANRTVVLLIVKPGGIEDRMVASTVRRLATLPTVSTFVVPADRIAHYSAITQGVRVERVPALVVVRPKNLDGGVPTASLSYGYQSPQSVVQAVVDANYRGRTLGYHP